MFTVSRDNFMGLVEEKERCKFREKRVTKILGRITTSLSGVDIEQLYWAGKNTKMLCTILGLSNYELRTLVEKPVRGQCIECDEDVFWMSVAKKQEHDAGKVIGTKDIRCSACQVAKDEQERIDNSHRWDVEKDKERDVLEKLQSMSYDQYLKTIHWDNVRQAALSRAGYQCQLCNGQGELHVHHRTYERRGDERRNDVIVLCKQCHGVFHNKEN